MNCAQFQDVVNDLTRNAGLDETTQQRALAHAASCPRCGQALAEAQALTDALRSLAVRDATAEAPRHLEDSLRRTFRERQSPVARSAGSGWWTLAAVAGLAAAAVFAVFVLRRPGATGPELGAGSGTSSLSQERPPQTGATLRAGNRASEQAAPRNAKVDATSRRLAPPLDESARAFVPLAFSEGSMSPEDEVVVRLSLPPSALASFGVPVSDAGRDENILADFIVGEDGTPRAVRVVY